MTGSGTLLDPFIIWDVNDLQDVSLGLAAYYELGQDIDASATIGWNWDAIRGVFEGFIPIVGFTGNFDGKGYVIDSLYINLAPEVGIADSPPAGLFETAVGAEISNVGLTNCDVRGGHPTGGLIGLASGGTVVTACYSTGAVHLYGPTAMAHYGGGLVGEATGAGCLFSRCFSTATVTGYSRNDWGSASVGGFVGRIINNAIARDCYARGNVVGDVYPGFPAPRTNAGGFACNMNTNALVDNCYATGNHIDTGFVGGVDGGLIGNLVGGAICTDSFWDTDTSGILVSAGGTGRTTAQMKTETTFTGVGWDFDTIWNILPGINDGYPFLRGLIIAPPEVSTNPATAISRVSATLNGFLDDDGGLLPCVCGFEWGLTDAYGLTTPTESKVTGESFSQAIYGLFPGFTYHFRAFATNSMGTGYGADRSFTTTPTFNRAHALSREEL